MFKSIQEKSFLFSFEPVFVCLSLGVVNYLFSGILHHKIFQLYIITKQNIALIFDKIKSNIFIPMVSTHIRINEKLRPNFTILDE